MGRVAILLINYKTMKYLRKNENGEYIYNCPDCQAELHATDDLLKYLLHKHFSEKSKAMCAKLTPEQRVAKAKMAVKTRWDKYRSINGTGAPTTNQ
jgi:hypothetical protein